jgi:hypothetical protein
VTIPFVDEGLLCFLGSDKIIPYSYAATAQQIANLREHCICMYIVRLNMNWAGDLYDHRS